MTRSGLSLLAYLLLQPRQFIPRARIMDIFWGEHAEARARSCLNSALWRLRNLLATENNSEEEYVVTTEDGQVGFNWASPYWFDVERVEQINALLTIAPTAMTAAEVQTLEAASNCYAGELLEGFYDDWALRERERLRALYISGLAHLMQYHTHHGNHERSLAYGQQILNLDPLREEIHRALMRLYLQTGQRAKALQQYDRCATAITDELGVDPMEETQLLYAQIVGITTPVTNPTPTVSVSDYQQALRVLKLARKRLDEVDAQLRRTIHLLEQSSRMLDPHP